MKQKQIATDSWQETSLGSLCQMKSGEMITARELHEGGRFPCYGGNGLRGYTGHHTHTGPLSLVGRQGALCGNVQEVKGNFHASEHAIVAKAHSNVSQEWLTHILKSLNLNRFSESSAQPGLSVKKLEKIVLIAPIDKNEQTNIANALSDADALIDALEKLIAKKRQIKQGAMQELLSGERRLPGFEGKWREINLGRDAILKARIGWQGLTTAEYLKSGDYHLVTGTEIVDGTIDWGSCWYVQKERYAQDLNIQLRLGDILVTKDGTIGKIAYIDGLPIPATLNSGVFVIRSREDKFEHRFLSLVLRSSIFDDFLRKLSAGSTINHLYQKDFVGFSFLAPPTSEEQSAISSALWSMNMEIKMLESKINKARQIKQGMMQELLTGRIRLV